MADSKKDDGGVTLEQIGKAADYAVMGASALANVGALLNTISGTLPKAMLFVPKLASDADTDPASAIKDMTGGMIGGIADDIAAMQNDDVMALRNLVKKKKKSKTAGVLSAAAGQVVDPNLEKKTAIKTSYSALATELGAYGYVAMEMQYNPSSIRISTVGGAMYNSQGASDSGARVRSCGKTRSTLSVQLVFQQVNAQDAFWYEGMNLNTAINTAASMAKTAFTKNGYSVKVPVEGLLSLIHFKRSKQVIFFWSEMFFHGELTSVSVNYKMFNSRGTPIYATVDLSMEEPDSGLQYKSDNQAWDEAFDAAFGSAGVGTFTSM